MAVYLLGMDDAIPVDEVVGELDRTLEFDRLHTSPSGVNGALFTFNGQTAMMATWQACGSCHEEAYVKWQNSHHSKAFTTLVARRNSGDARCVPCHTDQSATAPIGLAVTCESCHSSPGGSVSAATCARCHTSVTDPLSSFLAKLSTICIEPSGTGGQCKGDRGLGR
jgi:hypothetical protein